MQSYVIPFPEIHWGSIQVPENVSLWLNQISVFLSFPIGPVSPAVVGASVQCTLQGLHQWSPMKNKQVIYMEEKKGIYQW